MTEENYKYRTGPLFLRNQFKRKGKLQIPVIPKFEIQPDDFNDLLLIGFDKISTNDTKHFNRMVHFFLYDYKFERVWKTPDEDMEKLKCYRAVLSPDFSMYVEMAPILQLYNTFRNRWCGAYFASKGIRVVPTVSWGDEDTFEFCFEGIEKGSTVAVSTYMVSEHDNRQDQKEFFLKGYNEMLRRIEPEKIICYDTPFPEMQGNIVFVDYDRSSWKYMVEDSCVPSKYAKYICGEEPLPAGSDLIIKSGYVVSENDGDYNNIVRTGMGSAYGGKWRPDPNKPEDQRLVGNPGDIKKYGYRETHIGENGLGDRERHNTDHGNPKAHTNPHDHIITWENNHPNFSPQINYPDGVPEFKKYGGYSIMGGEIINTPEQNRFVSISDFKWCMSCGGEVEFDWAGQKYGVSHLKEKIIIYLYNQPDTTRYFSTADDALEYMVGNDRLRDVITQVTVIDRTI